MRYFFAFLASVLATAPAFAAVPEPGGINLQPAATRIMERLHDFHNYLLIIITVITIFVAALLLWVCFAYSKKRNPEPRKFSHNTTIEIVWTVVPVIILVAIAGPSFSNLFYQENEPDLVAIAQSGNVDDPNVNVEAAEKGWITVKAIGMGNWAWTYEYPDIVDDAGFPLSFVSNGIHLGLPTDPPATPERPLYLAADYPMVIPVNRYIRYQTASDRVIHSWTVPAFGVKTDAIPGRLNEGWFLVRETGVYYGQCSELCGKNHAFMPIEVRVVTQEQYDRWVEVMKTGDIDAATQMVHNFDPAGEQTQLASVDLN
ncbi:cytochrome c oxidase subunit II [Hyphomonas sp. FCG-A18]|uniref:cytochrome c oxidase subunit II n=1 Tax=Hyphomonas sp. FCG-A18 TaxID=3080019 RepID=UPI002B2E5DB1|nr:cytochrome c oxidase subunit II [Hyphomonas sp. FCG-A18]